LMAVMALMAIRARAAVSAKAISDLQARRSPDAFDYIVARKSGIRNKLSLLHHPAAGSRARRSMMRAMSCSAAARR